MHTPHRAPDLNLLITQVTTQFLIQIKTTSSELQHGREHAAVVERVSVFVRLLVSPVLCFQFGKTFTCKTQRPLENWKWDP